MSRVLVVLVIVICYAGIVRGTGIECVGESKGELYPGVGVQPTNKSCEKVENFNETMYRSLIEFYESTKGEEWINKGNWTAEGVSPCMWGGIECNEECSVVGLYLENNNLEGSIPEGIGNLTDLNYVYLRCNRIEGGLSNLEYCKELNTLNLNSNEIAEELPSFEEQKGMVMIDLGYNKIQGTLPASYGSFINLETLALNDNQIKGTIPEEYQSLENLKNILLANNQLEGTIGNLFEKMQRIRWIDLSMNKFSGSLPSFSPKSFIGELILNNNLLNGTIPKSWNHLRVLEKIMINNNQLSGGVEFLNITAENGLLSTLSLIDLSDNLFEGNFPDFSILLLSSFIARNNLLSGDVGFSFGPHLNLIDIRSNPNAIDFKIDLYLELGLLKPTDAVINYANYSCPYLQSMDNKTLILTDPTYYQYSLCTPNYFFSSSPPVL